MRISGSSGPVTAHTDTMVDKVHDHEVQKFRGSRQRGSGIGTFLDNFGRVPGVWPVTLGNWTGTCLDT